MMMERAHLLKTGRLARPFDEYHTVELEALLLFDDEAANEIVRMANAGASVTPDWTREAIGGTVPTGVYRPPSRAQLQRAVTHGEPILTGDILADEWERQIARGEMPDLDLQIPRPEVTDAW